MKNRCLYAICFFLFSPSLSWSAYWVDEFSGSSQNYHIVRDGKQVKANLLMALNAGDKITVKHKDGKLTLVREDNYKIILTNKDATYTVPDPQSPPSIMDNLNALISKWYRSKSSNVTTVAAVTRGGEQVLWLGASNDENLIFSEMNELILHWHGDSAPFQVQLLDASERIVAEKKEIKENNVKLSGLNLKPGNYGLEVKGLQSAYYIAVKVVESGDKPIILKQILELNAPEIIKYSYAVMVLSSRQEWRFQALQLAEKHGLQDLKRKILSGNILDRI